MRSRFKECEKKPSAISGAFSLTVSAIIVKLLGVIYKIPLAGFLGEEGMGYFNSAYTVYSLFYILCTAGVPKAVMILVCKAREEQNTELSKKIVITGMKSFGLLGVLATAVLIIFSDPLATLVGNSNSAQTMLAVAPSVLFISIAGVLRGYMSADMRFGEIAVSQIIEGAGKLVLGLLFAIGATKKGLPLPIISALTILGVSFGAMFGLFYLLACAKIKNAHNNQRQIWKFGETRKITKRILSISLPITLSAAVMSITSVLDLAQIIRGLTEAGFSVEEATALYGNYTTLAVPMFNLALAVVSPISAAYMPIFARAYNANDSELLRDSLESSVKFSAFLCAPIILGICVYSREILSLLFGGMGINTGASLLLLLTPAIFFSSNLLISNSALEACGCAKAPVISMLSGSVAKLAISFVLIKNPEFGIFGAPIGTTVCYAIALIVSLILVNKKLPFDIPIFKNSAKPYLLATISILPTRYVFEIVKARASVNLSFIICVCISAAFYLTLSFFGGTITKIERTKMSKYTKSA